MSERERIAAELHEQYLATARRLNWPLRPDVDHPYEQLSDAAKELDRVFADWHLAELERHQAEDRAAIRALKSAGEAMHRAVDELLTEFVSKKRAANWGVINDAGVALGKAIKEHAAAIQRARGRKP